MEHVGEARARAVVDVGFATNDFRDHRQATDEGGQGVTDAYRKQIFVQVGFALVRIDLVDRFCTEERLDASDQREHDDVLDADARHYTGEVRESQRAEHVARDVYEETWPEFMVPAGKRNDLFAADVKVQAERNCNQQHQHRRGDDPEFRILDELEAEHDEQADAADDGDDRVHLQEVAGNRQKPVNRSSGALEAEHDRKLRGDHEHTDRSE